VVAKEEALVRGIDDDRVVRQPLPVEEVEQPPDVLVERRDAAQVVLDVALVAPAQLLVLGEPRRGRSP